MEEWTSKTTRLIWASKSGSKLQSVGTAVGGQKYCRYGSFWHLGSFLGFDSSFSFFFWWPKHPGYSYWAILMLRQPPLNSSQTTIFSPQLVGVSKYSSNIPQISSNIPQFHLLSLMKISPSCQSHDFFWPLAYPIAAKQRPSLASLMWALPVVWRTWACALRKGGTRDILTYGLVKKREDLEDTQIPMFFSMKFRVGFV